MVTKDITWDEIGKYLDIMMTTGRVAPKLDEALENLLEDLAAKAGDEDDGGPAHLSFDKDEKKVGVLLSFYATFIQFNKPDEATMIAKAYYLLGYTARERHQ